MGQKVDELSATECFDLPEGLLCILTLVFSRAKVGVLGAELVADRVECQFAFLVLKQDQ